MNESTGVSDYALVASRQIGQRPDDEEAAATQRVALDSSVPVPLLLRALGLKALDQRAFTHAVAYWDALTQLQADDADAWFGLGYANQRLWIFDLDIYALYRALAAYEKAAGLAPENATILAFWGSALSEQAQSNSEGAADALYAKAYEKFEQALAIDPSHADALNNWGTALLGQAFVKPPEQADPLYELACEKFRLGAEQRPDDAVAFNNWSNALLSRARPLSGEQRLALLAQAEENSLIAERLSPGRGAYNLGCIHALRNQPDEAQQWLKKAEDLRTLAGCSHMQRDPDLDSLRELDWFQALVDNLCGNYDDDEEHTH